MKNWIATVALGALTLSGLTALSSTADDTAPAGTVATEASGYYTFGGSTNDKLRALSNEKGANPSSRSSAARAAGQSSTGTIEKLNASVGKTGKLSNTPSLKNAKSSTAGAGATTHLGTILIKDVVIDGKLNNAAQITDSANIAQGKNARATMGSVSISGGRVSKSGIVSNTAVINSSLNMAKGKNTVSSMGSINLEDTRVQGKITSKTRMDETSNVNIGDKNRGSVGSIEISGSNINKAAILHNSALSRKSNNIGIGYNNNTNAASVNVE